MIWSQAWDPSRGTRRKKKKVVFSLLPQKQSLKWSFLGKPFIKGMHTERKQEKKGK